ncbi:MAG: cytochrome c [Trueperaceae bacterium]|nr:cytochrome c [Trueperaceae bacterium]
MACHQANGQGIPAAFPPLAGHMPDLYSAEGGREYIINVVLYGLMGEIEVNGAKYNSVMTPWAAVLSDEQIAATLNHELTSWGNDALLTDFMPIMPEEVAAQRDKGLSSADVLGLRPE